jgi:hypothetical protein
MKYKSKGKGGKRKPKLLRLSTAFLILNVTTNIKNEKNEINLRIFNCYYDFLILLQ